LRMHARVKALVKTQNCSGYSFVSSFNMVRGALKNSVCWIFHVQGRGVMQRIPCMTSFFGNPFMHDAWIPTQTQHCRHKIK
jgi:hypothetical protein